MKASFGRENALPCVLRLFRIGRDLTIKDLSAEMGVSPSYICDIERGAKKPSLATIEKYSKALKVPKSTLLFFDEQQKKNGFSYQDLLIRILRSIIEEKEEIPPISLNKMQE